MSIKITESFNHHVIEVAVSDTLTPEFYTQLTICIENALTRNRKVQLLVLILGFRGWDQCTFWDQMTCDISRLQDVERVAIVAESKWFEGVSRFSQPFGQASFRNFDQNRLDAAREWLEEAIFSNFVLHRADFEQTPQRLQG